VRAAAALLFSVAGGGVFDARTAFAEGGPPMVTDDPDTPGDGNSEITLSWTSERISDSKQDELPLAGLRLTS
jgi:hypothetical protein